MCRGAEPKIIAVNGRLRKATAGRDVADVRPAVLADRFNILKLG